MNRIWPAVWLIAASLMLLPAIDTLLPAHLAATEWPRTPLDKAAPIQAEQWSFLREAWKWVPRGAIITVKSADLHDEMSLYMMALGMFMDNELRAGSYMGVPMEGTANDATVVLEFPCTTPREGFRCVPVERGCVCERRRF